MARRLRSVESSPAASLSAELAAFDATDWPVTEAGSIWDDLVTVAGPVHAREILAREQWVTARRAWCASQGLSLRDLA